MLKNTFTKTLFTKRWMLLFWSAGLLLLTVFTMLFFPTFKEVGQSFKDVPESLKSFLGDATAYSSIQGFTDLQVVGQYVFMTLILGVILFTGVLAGEEGSGTLQSLLVQPVSRGRVYIEKLLAAMVILAVVCVAVAVGILVGAVLVGEWIPLDRLLLAAFAMWLITLVFSSFGFALGAILGRRGIAGGIAGVLAFVSLLISTLAESVKSLKVADQLSPFHYFNRPGILANGIEASDMVVLALIAIVPLIVAYFVFVRRDIYGQ